MEPQSAYCEVWTEHLSVIYIIIIIIIIIIIKPANAHNIYSRLVFMNSRFGGTRWGTALQAERSRVRFPMVSIEIFIDIIFPTAL